MELSDKKFNDMAHIFSGFSFGVLQGFNQILELSSRHGFTTDEIYLYVLENKRAFQKSEDLRKKLSSSRLELKKCPRCGMPMNLQQVNNCASTNIGGPWKCVLTCVNGRDCGYQIFEKDPFDIVRIRLLRESGFIEKHKIKRNVHGFPPIDELNKSGGMD